MKLRPRPGLFYVSRCRTVLATHSSGFVGGPDEAGLFVRETRLLSRYEWLIDGKAPRPIALSNVEQHTWMGYYVSTPPGPDLGPPDEGSGHVPKEAEHTLELRLRRSVADGVHEDVDLRNYGAEPTRFRLTVRFDADFADYGELSGRRLQQGTRTTTVHDDGVRIDYSAEHHFDHQEGAGRATFACGVEISARTPAPAHIDGRSMTFDVDLAPGGHWHACVELVPHFPGESRVVLPACGDAPEPATPYDELTREQQERQTRFSAPGSPTLTATVISTLEQARRDLLALRLFDLDADGGWTVAAGLPIYVALFGRDTLTAAWEAALLGPELMRGTLPVIADRQGVDDNPWRDEQPGRMLHEAHSGPLSALNYIPQARYFGSVTTSGFFPFVVAELWHWTGDREAVERYIDPALRALRWLDERCDLDGDGFYEYRSRSEKGVQNQGWKDSADAIVDERGRLVDPPVATCEEQAFVYVAKLHFSTLLWALGRREEGRRLFQEARELKKRFNEHFWCDDLDTLALGLGPDKRPIRSVTSNPGHCLAAGIVDSSLAARAASRLMMDDLFSGWGVRTLSSQHPAFNPYSYHRGSVWPVEQGTFVVGFVRYGLHDHAARLARALFDSAAVFEHLRLPEVISGHPRDARHPFPAMYPSANSPQAWSSSAAFSMLQALLGLYPYAPLNLLVIDPHLPAWLPDLTLTGLRVGPATVSLRFFRRDDGASDYEVLAQEGKLRIVRQPSPWSLTAGAGERLSDLLASLAH